jgi:hypothetical protein
MHYSYSMDEIALEIEVPAKVLRRFLSEEAGTISKAADG